MGKPDETLALFRAGVPVSTIRDRLGYRSVTQVEAVVRHALEDAAKRRGQVPADQVELDRVEALYRGIYPKALKGDTKAIETCLRLQNEMARLRNLDGPRAGLAAAFDETTNELDLSDADGAVVATGRAIAAQIDEALAYGTPLERTKALYLVPHLMSVLRDLGATPQARAEVQQLVKTTQKAPLSALDEWRAKQPKVG